MTDQFGTHLEGWFEHVIVRRQLSLPLRTDPLACLTPHRGSDDHMFERIVTTNCTKVAEILTSDPSHTIVSDPV